MAMHHSDGYVPFWVEVNERRFDKAERDPGRNFKSTLHPIRVYPRLAQGDDTLANVLGRVSAVSKLFAMTDTVLAEVRDPKFKLATRLPLTTCVVCTHR